MKPICHASPALFDPTGEPCASCEHAVGCHAGALLRLDRMPDLPETRAARLRLTTLGRALTSSPGEGAARVQLSRRGIARRALSAAEQLALQALPERARSTAKRLAELGWFDYARGQLERRQLPDTAGSQALRIACQRLLSGGCSRRELVAAFEVELGLKPGSAQVEASKVIALLQFGQLARFTSGQLSAQPSFQ